MTSLRRSLLEWLLPMLMIAGVAAALGGYTFMERRLETAFDHDLGDVARTLVPYLRPGSEGLLLGITEQSDAVLRADSADQVYYAVRNGRGELIAGDPLVPMPPDFKGETAFWDAFRLNEPVRAVALRAVAHGTPVTVVATETRRKRELAARDALFSSMGPVALLLVATALAILIGVGRGLAPVEALRQALADRSPEDLRALDEAPVASELRPMVRALNDLLGRLEEARGTQARFIANAAHQLRTPIAGLVTQIDLARGGPDAEAHLENARVAAARLARLAQQVLSLAAADPISNPSTLDAPCDLAHVVRDHAATWVRASARAELAFALEPAPVRGSALLLGELASNLVDNAVRYGGRNVTVTTGVAGERSILAVEDDGPGIPPEDRTRILERFQRGPHADREGSGLGLAIVKEIAQRHGGHVEIADATTGVNGTRVTVSFPSTPREP